MSKSDASQMVAKLVKIHGLTTKKATKSSGKYCQTINSESDSKDKATDISGAEKEVLFYKSKARELKVKLKELVKINNSLATEMMKSGNGNDLGLSNVSLKVAV